MRSSPVCDCALTVARTHTHKRFFSPRERASLIVAVHGGPRTTAWPRERKDRGRERELKGESEREAKERVLCAHEGGGGERGLPLRTCRAISTIGHVRREESPPVAAAAGRSTTDGDP